MRRRETIGRGALCVALVSGAALVLLVHGRVRSGEADLSAAVLRGILRVDSVANSTRPVFYFHLPAGPEDLTGTWVGLHVTGECTVAWLIAPLMVVCGLVVIGPRIRPRIVLIAASLTAAVLVAVNIVRILLVALATHWWGVDVGYRWSHHLLGSVVTVVGVGVAIALFVRLTTSLSRSRLVA